MDTNETDNEEFFLWHEEEFREFERQENAKIWLVRREEYRRQARARREQPHYQHQYGDNLLWRYLAYMATGFGVFVIVPGIYAFYVWIAGGNR